MNTASPDEDSIRVNREPVYFEDGRNSFFGWYHTAISAIQRDCAFVICNPMGYEYIHSHRSIRHLADHLAQHGFPTMRFDYHGTGDSPGTDLDPDRWQCWQGNVSAAIKHARECSGRKRVCLLGVRLGATLAAVVASKLEVDFLVLWNPCISGHRYLREIQAVAASGDSFANESDGSLESAGFVMSAETITALRDVSLLSMHVKVSGRTLVIGRDDLSSDRSLPEHLTANGVSNDCVCLSGYAEMMAEPQFTVVPTMAISTIADWAVKHTARAPEISGASQTRSNDTIKFLFQGEQTVTTTIEEKYCQFGEHEKLFGILSRPDAPSNYPTIVLFNAGSVHHVGPNRLYVTLARNLAALGFASFRFDLEGIGDSVCRSNLIRENHPYPDTATADAKAALGYLMQEFGYARVIALGLCSGAHTAFQLGLTFDSDSLTELILINPLTFYWVEGMSLETTRQFKEVSYYKQSVRNPDSWRKLLRGKVNVVNLARVAVSYLRTLGKSHCESLFERFRPEAGSQLSMDLKKLVKMNRTLTFIIAEGDPGRDILMASSRRTVLSALQTKKMHLQMIAGADHTFTQSAARKELIVCLVAILTRQLGHKFQ